MSDEKPAVGFVPLKSLQQGPPDPAAALAEIRKIYFRTSRQTIDNDLAHAIELLKSLPDEESRSKAHVYMEGLAEMRNEWGRDARGPRGKGQRPKVGGQRVNAPGQKGKPAGHKPNSTGRDPQVEAPPSKDERGRS